MSYLVMPSPKVDGTVLSVEKLDQPDGTAGPPSHDAMSWPISPSSGPSKNPWYFCTPFDWANVNLNDPRSFPVAGSLPLEPDREPVTSPLHTNRLNSPPCCASTTIPPLPSDCE